MSSLWCPVVGFALAATALVALAACGASDAGTGRGAARGDRLYHGEATCATCHGGDLRGTSMGPPLLDPIYAPGHHPDEAFQAAVRNGVQPHHWQLGPMPALVHLDRDDVDDIVTYVRQQQRAAGIR